jgi:aspartate/methionine/tyrosine aminotransferase
MSVEDVQAYVEHHQICDVVQDAINAAVQAQSPDPQLFMSQWLAKDLKNGNALQRNPEPFKLERYFGVHEFTAKVLLSSSDVESLSMKELLQIAADAKDEASIALWDNLSLGYTESQGHPDFLAAIAANYSDAVQPANLLEVAPEEGIFLAVSALISPGDKVIVSWPCYQSLHEVARARGAEVRKWPYTCDEAGDEPHFEVEELEAQVAHAGGSVKLIVINFPHNPTGCWLSAQELRRVVDVARKAGAYLFSDEMHGGGHFGAP